jgi:hypothetical protein
MQQRLRLIILDRPTAATPRGSAPASDPPAVPHRLLRAHFVRCRSLHRERIRHWGQRRQIDHIRRVEDSGCPPRGDPCQAALRDFIFFGCGCDVASSPASDVHRAAEALGTRTAVVAAEVKTQIRSSNQRLSAVWARAHRRFARNQWGARLAEEVEKRRRRGRADDLCT